MNIHRVTDIRIEGTQVCKKTEKHEAFSTAKMVVTGVGFQWDIHLFSTPDKSFVDRQVLAVDGADERGDRYSTSELFVHNVKGVSSILIPHRGNEWFEIYINRGALEEYHLRFFYVTGKTNSFSDAKVVEGELMSKNGE